MNETNTVKTLYLSNGEYFAEYRIEFNDYELKTKIEGLLTQNLESYYVENENVVSTNSAYSYIQSSYDLVTYLKRTFFEEEIVDLSEITDLIKSNNSKMRTPQTLLAISNILASINFKIVSKLDIEYYTLLIRQAFRKGLINNPDYEHNLIDIGCKNNKVLDNLNLVPNPNFNVGYQKAITK